MSHGDFRSIAMHNGGIIRIAEPAGYPSEALDCGYRISEICHFLLRPSSRSFEKNPKRPRRFRDISYVKLCMADARHPVRRIVVGRSRAKSRHPELLLGYPGLLPLQLARDGQRYVC